LRPESNCTRGYIPLEWGTSVIESFAPREWDAYNSIKLNTLAMVTRSPDARA